MSASYHRFKLGLGLKKRDIFKPKNRFDLAFDDIENLTLPLKEMSSNGDFAKGNNRETKYVSSTDKRSNIPAEGFVSKELGKQQEIVHYHQAMEQLLTKCKTLEEELSSRQKTIDCLMQQNELMKNSVQDNMEQHQEREIARLKKALQDCQLENHQLSHKLYVVSNDPRQTNSNAAAIADQLRNYGKMLQKERTYTIQLRNQLGEKDRMYGRIIEELQAANRTLSNNIDQMSSQLDKSENCTQRRHIQCDASAVQLEIANKRIKACEQQLAAQRANNDQQMYKKMQELSNLQTRLKVAENQHSQSENKLHQQLQRLKTERRQDMLMIEKKAKNVKYHSEVIVLEKRVNELTKQNDSLREIVEEKTRVVQQLHQQLSLSYSADKYQQLQKDYHELDSQQHQLTKQYQERLLELQKQNDALKLKSLNQLSLPEDKGNFHDALRRNIQQNQKIKQQLTFRGEENSQLREELVELRLKQQQFLNEIDILTKKVKSSDKNHKIEQEVEQQTMKNEIERLRRKLSTAESLLQSKTKDIQQKDAFIKNSIIGRSRTEDVPLIMADLERLLLTIELKTQPPLSSSDTILSTSK